MKKPKNQADTIQELEQKAKHNTTKHMKHKRMGGSQLKPNPEVTVAVFGGMFAFLRGTV